MIESAKLSLSRRSTLRYGGIGLISPALISRKDDISDYILGIASDGTCKTMIESIRTQFSRFLLLKIGTLQHPGNAISMSLSESELPLFIFLCSHVMFTA